MKGKDISNFNIIILNNSIPWSTKIRQRMIKYHNLIDSFNKILKHLIDFFNFTKK